jgi:transposase
MMGLPAGTSVWIAAGVTDMRRGFDGLAAIVQSKLEENRMRLAHPHQPPQNLC